jgi:type II secretory pathway component PulK
MQSERSRARSSARARAAGSEGFALPIVIWSVGAIAVLFATYVGAARHRMIEGVAVASRARAEASANIGIKLAILDLLPGASAAASGRRFGQRGEATQCALDDGSRLAVAVADEAGKVDINAASPELLQALLRAVAADERSRAALGKGILDRRAAASSAGEGEAAFVSVLELDAVPGSDSRTVASLLPLVTVHSRSSGVDPATAPGALLRSLAALPESTSPGEALARFPTAFSVASLRRAFLVSSEATLASGARLSRDAVVEINADLPGGYRIREWRDGSLESGSATSTGRLPPC